MDSCNIFVIRRYSTDGVISAHHAHYFKFLFSLNNYCSLLGLELLHFVPINSSETRVWMGI